MRCKAMNKGWPALQCELEEGHRNKHWHNQVGHYNWPEIPVQTDFERFAMDHKAHRHCQACGGCLLDPAWYVQQFPAWCVGCRDRIKKALPAGALAPWHGGWEL